MRGFSMFFSCRDYAKFIMGDSLWHAEVWSFAAPPVCLPSPLSVPLRAPKMLIVALRG